MTNNVYIPHHNNRMFKHDDMMHPHERSVMFVIPGKDEFVNLLDNDYCPSLWHISRGLSTINRYSGRCRPFYSVAYHSYVVHNVVSGISPRVEDAIFALVHDASEIFTGDIPSPVKKMSADIPRFENTIVSKVIDKYYAGDGRYFDENCPRVVNRAERMIAHLEMRVFLDSDPEPYATPETDAEKEAVAHAEDLLKDDKLREYFDEEVFFEVLVAYSERPPEQLQKIIE